MKLNELDTSNQIEREAHGTHSAVILTAQDALAEIWNGEHDSQDTITVLRTTADRLRKLATAIERNKDIDNQNDNDCEND